MRKEKTILFLVNGEEIGRWIIPAFANADDEIKFHHNYWADENVLALERKADYRLVFEKPDPAYAQQLLRWQLKYALKMGVNSGFSDDQLKLLEQLVMGKSIEQVKKKLNKPGTRLNNLLSEMKEIVCGTAKIKNKDFIAWFIPTVY